MSSVEDTENKHLTLEEEVNNLREAYQALQEQNEALQQENESLKLKLQSQSDAMNENNTSESVATAAAAAQLNNYQQALNLSEAQKQQVIAENESLKAKLVHLGITFAETTEVVADTTNDPTVSNETLTVIAEDEEVDESWDEKFNALVKFKETHGHLQISYEDEPIIAKWIQTQRILQRNKALMDKRTEKLNSINFFEETADVPDVASGAVVAVAAMDHATGLDISAAEAEALAAVDTAVHHTHHHDATAVTVLTSPGTGLSSRSDEKWEQHYQRLVDYKTANGNCLVPTSTELGRWLCRQRHNHRYKGLKEERKLRLMDLDPTCLGERLSDINGSGEELVNGEADPNSTIPNTPHLTTKTKYNLAYESKLHAKWDHYFQQLVAYKNEHGHSNFPTMNGSLGRWISRQRTLYRSQKLKSDRFEKLKSIEFAFEDATALEFKGKLDQQWENMFKQLTQHKERTGHCFDVPEDMPLGKWLYRQRWLYRHGNLRDDRAKKLLEIGFEDKKVLKKDVDGGKKRKRKRPSTDLIVDEQTQVQEQKPEEEQTQVIHSTTDQDENESKSNGVGIPFDQIMDDRATVENEVEPSIVHKQEATQV